MDPEQVKLHRITSPELKRPVLDSLRDAHARGGTVTVLAAELGALLVEPMLDTLSQEAGIEEWRLSELAVHIAAGVEAATVALVARPPIR